PDARPVEAALERSHLPGAAPRVHDDALVEPAEPDLAVARALGSIAPQRRDVGVGAGGEQLARAGVERGPAGALVRRRRRLGGPAARRPPPGGGEQRRTEQQLAAGERRAQRGLGFGLRCPSQPPPRPPGGRTRGARGGPPPRARRAPPRPGGTPPSPARPPPARRP